MIDSPGFNPPSDHKSIRIPPTGDSAIFVFMLTPNRAGSLKVNVQILLGDAVIGSRLLATNSVATTAAGPSVAYAVVSVPVAVPARVPRAPARAMPPAARRPGGIPGSENPTGGGDTEAFRRRPARQPSASATPPTPPSPVANPGPQNPGGGNASQAFRFPPPVRQPPPSAMPAVPHRKSGRKLWLIAGPSAAALAVLLLTTTQFGTNTATHTYGTSLPSTGIHSAIPPAEAPQTETELRAWLAEMRTRATYIRKKGTRPLPPSLLAAQNRLDRNLEKADNALKSHQPALAQKCGLAAQKDLSTVQAATR